MDQNQQSTALDNSEDEDDKIGDEHPRDAAWETETNQDQDAAEGRVYLVRHVQTGLLRKIPYEGKTLHPVRFARLHQQILRPSYNSIMQELPTNPLPSCFSIYKKHFKFFVSSSNKSLHDTRIIIITI